jgi:hypothetical protein
MSTSARLFVSFPVLPQVREYISSRCSADFNETNTVLSSDELACCFWLARRHPRREVGSSTLEARVSMAAVLLDAMEELARGSNPRNRLV